MTDGTFKATMTPQEIYRPVRKCRVCGRETLSELMDLGLHAITDFHTGNRQTLRAPLTLVRCAECELVQLGHSVNRDLLFSNFYWYRSNMNRTMRDHLHELAAEAERTARLRAPDLVVDIGCNDGTLFEGFKTADLVKVGFEPGPNTAAIAREKGIAVIQDYFSAKAFKAIYGSVKARLVTAIAMFYDLDDPEGFCRDVASIMTEDGVFCIQMNDLWSMVTKTTYDIIGHEHVTYWPLSTLQMVLAGAGLEIFSIEHNELNGGSLRAWAARRGQRPVLASVSVQLAHERTVLTGQGFSDFIERVRRSSMQLADFVAEERARGGRVYCYGASTRGNTILQTAGLTAAEITGIAEIHPDKIGKIMAGPDIPIVSEADARSMATAFVVLPYSYKREFVEREADFLRRGGKLVFPLPEFEVVTA